MQTSRRSFALLLAAVPLFFSSCSDGPAGPENGFPDPAGGLALSEVVSGVPDPVHLTAPPGDDRLFVVEQSGRIWVVRDGELLEAPFLDLQEFVSSGGERGLLSMAFHPEYEVNGRFYVNYTDDAGDTRVVGFLASSDSDRADAESAETLLHVEQPFPNHNGGHIAFGPDGKLYVAMGDGGGSGDPLGSGQDPGTLLGALLRIDVDGGQPYGIPPDNPFVDEPSARDEIWAIGLRNPWRISFDEPSGTLYIADVGQHRWEEVNAESADAPGLNYGWNVMEGEECFDSQECNPSDLTLPVMTYRTGPEGCAVVGGDVYRGEDIPEVEGHYFYSDWCGGWLRSFRIEGGAVVDEREWNVGHVGRILSMGQDARGELYMLSSEGGTVYRIVAEGTPSNLE